MKLCNIRPLNDGTNGFRFDVIGCKGLYRKRKNLRRFGINSAGNTFVQVHLGKRSVYLEQFNPAKVLHDFALLKQAKAKLQAMRRVSLEEF